MPFDWQHATVHDWDDLRTELDRAEADTELRTDRWDRESDRLAREQEAEWQADHDERLRTDPDYAAEHAYRLAGGRDPQGPLA
ncbi:MAG TPA: hypothetical protein VFZ00_20530 [Solirubrobacter sp.]|nr:hypothetical protein [Solirubrobacter sp.]